jgi:hypothetical protein
MRRRLLAVAEHFRELPMGLESQRLVRTLALVWSRLGRGRYYVTAALTVLVLCAAVGVAHLLSPPPERNASANPESKKTTEPVSEKAVIAITEIGKTETKGRHGQLGVSLKIGVAPIADARKGEVEIRVAFFDMNAAGEMQPTNAQVDYEWITPVRNWADPSPKYLVATYQGTRPSRDSAQQLRYGGFLVRVYFDGRLQAESSDPKELVASLRNRPAPTSAELRAATPTSRAIAAQSRVEPQPFETPRPTDQVSPSAAPLQPAANSTALPYGSPVPDKAGFVYSPYDAKFLIDVRGFPPGTEVTDPNSGKRFKVP